MAIYIHLYSPITLSCENNKPQETQMQFLEERRKPMAKH